MRLLALHKPFLFATLFCSMLSRCVRLLIETLCFVFAELGQLSGVAAILRFPLPDLEDSDSGDSDE